MVFMVLYYIILSLKCTYSSIDLDILYYIYVCLVAVFNMGSHSVRQLIVNVLYILYTYVHSLCAIMHVNSFQIVQDWHMFLLIGVLLAIDTLFLTVVTAVDQSRLRAVVDETEKTVCPVCLYCVHK